MSDRTFDCTIDFSSVDPADALMSGRLIGLRDGWVRQVESEGGIPAWGRFPLTDHPFLISRTLLVDIEEPGVRHRYRLCGSHMVDTFKFELTGKTVVEAFPDEVAERIHANHLDVAGQGRPLRLKGEIRVWQGRGVRGFEAVALPLSTDGQTCDKVLVAFDFDDEAAPARR